MTTKYIQPKDLFPSQPYGFSHVAVSQGTKVVSVAGQVALDENQKALYGFQEPVLKKLRKPYK